MTMLAAKTATDKMIKDFNLNSVPPKKRRKILQKISDHLDKVIMLTVLGSLDEHQFDKFKKALGSNDPSVRDAQIAGIVADVPGLSQKIQDKIELEYVIMKAALN